MNAAFAAAIRRMKEMRQTIKVVTNRLRRAATKEASTVLARLGQRLAWARAARGLSQDAVAVKLGISRSRLSRWELGLVPPPADKLVALATYLGRTPNELLLDVLPETVAPDLFPVTARLIENLGKILRKLSRDPAAGGTDAPVGAGRKVARG
jgi:transcriptional regulator with XRE-family HTH domain